MPTTEPLTLGELVRSRETDAVARLAAAAGDTSLCTLSRDGTSHPSAKYHEGAVAALAEARRALRDQTGAAASLEAVDAIRRAWTARTDTPLAGTAGWAAYLGGGIDALDDLRGNLDQEDHAARPEQDTHAGRSVQDHAGRAASPGERVETPPRPLVPRAGTPLPLRGAGSLLARRRVVATVALAPLLFAAFSTAGGGAAGPVGWVALVGLASLVGAAVLASYVPTSGIRPNLGCTPCAAASFVTLIGAATLLASTPHAAASAMLALGLVGLGLAQRLTGAGDSCPA